MKTKKSIENLIKSYEKKSCFDFVPEFVQFENDAEYSVYSYDGRMSNWAKALRFLTAGVDFEITSKRNVAPRGGRWGIRQTVHFLPAFFEKYGEFIESEKKRVEAIVARRTAELRVKQAQVAAFKAWAEANPEKIEAFEKKVDEAVKGLPSAKRSSKRKMMEGRRVEMALGIKKADWDSWKVYADAIDHFTFFEK